MFLGLYRLYFDHDCWLVCAMQSHLYWWHRWLWYNVVYNFNCYCILKFYLLLATCCVSFAWFVGRAKTGHKKKLGFKRKQKIKGTKSDILRSHSNSPTLSGDKDISHSQDYQYHDQVKKGEEITTQTDESKSTAEGQPVTRLAQREELPPASVTKGECLSLTMQYKY